MGLTNHQCLPFPLQFYNLTTYALRTAQIKRRSHNFFNIIGTYILKLKSVQWCNKCQVHLKIGLGKFFNILNIFLPNTYLPIWFFLQLSGSRGRTESSWRGRRLGSSRRRPMQRGLQFWNPVIFESAIFGIRIQLSMAWSWIYSHLSLRTYTRWASLQNRSKNFHFFAEWIPQNENWDEPLSQKLPKCWTFLGILPIT